MNAPQPKGLDAQQKLQYVEQLKKITQPMYNTSVDNLKAAVDKAYELDLYSEDISIAFEKLSKVDPKNYPYWDFQSFPTQGISIMEAGR